MPLGARERGRLLEVARAAIAATASGRAVAPPTNGGVLARPSGAFVTIRYEGALRGCIGATGRDEALIAVVSRCAAAAASTDPRFPPLKASLVASVQLEISVLGPIEPLTDIDTFEVGRHGLVVEEGDRYGLLLPQVAREHGWDRETFLEQACLKAGLGRRAWAEGAQLGYFEADVFGEPS